MNRKNLHYLGMMLLIIISFSFTTDNCNPYFPINKGDIWVYDEFDKKGNLSGTNTTEVEDVTVEGEKVTYKLKGITEGPKKKEKNRHEMSFDYVCENGVLKMSLDNMIPKETMEGMEDMNIEMTQTEIVIPSTLNVGDALDDASINMKASTNGITVMNMTVKMTNRKVEKLEEVTTEAGTYSCAVLSSDVTTDMGIMKQESSTKDWYSAKVGIVKSESYDKNGNLNYSRKLKSYTAGQ